MEKQYEDMLYGLFRLSKDHRYRIGLIQGFSSCGKMSNMEFDILRAQIKAGKNIPMLVPWISLQRREG